MGKKSSPKICPQKSRNAVSALENDRIKSRDSLDFLSLAAMTLIAFGLYKSEILIVWASLFILLSMCINQGKNAPILSNSYIAVAGCIMALVIMYLRTSIDPNALPNVANATVIN